MHLNYEPLNITLMYGNVLFFIFFTILAKKKKDSMKGGFLLYYFDVLLIKCFVKNINLIL